MSASPTRFQRFILPGLAFKAVVIGGGYATGRELAEFFMPQGPSGGLLGMALAMLVWSLVCALTFALAHQLRAYDYRSFFRVLLGRFWPVFETAFVLFMVLILAVFGAAAGSIAKATAGLPEIAGTLALMAGIAAFGAFGNASVERLFKWVSFLLYAVYAVFLVLVLSSFGTGIGHAFSAGGVEGYGWIGGGLTYASYNIVCVVMVLPVARHFLSRRDALAAGAIAGPLAMLPAMLFFVGMAAWYPQIADEALPSDYILSRLGHPGFQLLYQAMIFSALLESGTGIVHAVNERVAAAWRARSGNGITRPARLGIAALLLVGSIFVADRFGLVALIATGYRFLAWLFLAVFLLPLLTFGVSLLWRQRLTKPIACPDGDIHDPN